MVPVLPAYEDKVSGLPASHLAAKAYEIQVTIVEIRSLWYIISRIPKEVQKLKKWTNP